MKMIRQIIYRNFSKTVFLAAWVASSGLSAKVYFDSEKDPLPLFSLQVLIPEGMNSKTPLDAASMSLYSSILEDGTERLSKQEFLDAMMSYGASVSFGSGRNTSSWTLSFPIIEGKDYAPLMSLVEENWKQPRLTEESLQKARVKLDAALKASLDSDMQLAALVGRRWMGVQKFGLYPVLNEGVEQVTLSSLQNVRARLSGVQDIWAGYIGPDSHKELAKSFLRKVFSSHGQIKAGKLNRSLVKDPPAKKDFAAKPTAIIVEKPGRTQTVIFTTGVFQDFPATENEELALHFGGHILGFSGLGSYFGDEIRNKAGLAYTVSPLQKYFLGRPAVGFLTNPVRAKIEKTFEVVPDVLKAAYVEADIFRVLSEDVWQRQWQSFRYGYLLDNSSVAARLGTRQAVVSGELSPGFADSKPASWSISREELSRYFRQSYGEAAKVMVFVGEEKELRPYLEKHFPDYQIKVMGLNETLSAKAYEN